VDGILVDEGLLHARPGRQPDGHVLGTVMVRVHLREDLARTPGELSPRDLLDDLGQRHAYAAEPLDRSGFRPALRKLARVARLGRPCGCSTGL